MATYKETIKKVMGFDCDYGIMVHSIFSKFWHFYGRVSRTLNTGKTAAPGAVWQRKIRGTRAYLQACYFLGLG